MKMKRMKNQMKRMGKSPLLSFLLLFSLLFSCTENDMNKVPDGEMKIIVTPSKQAIVLEEDLIGTEALSVTWTKGSNMVTEYRFEIDVKGNSFATPQSIITQVSEERIITFNHEQLNDLILNNWAVLEANVANDFEIRVSGLDNAQVTIFSDVVEIQITTFAETPLPFDQLWLQGDAFDNLSQDERLLRYNGTTKKFVWQGILYTGSEFIIGTDPDEALPAYVKDGENTIRLRETASEPATPFTISQDNLYQIEVDIRKMTITVSAAQVIQEEVRIVGAVNDWDIENAPLLTIVSTNIYTYEGYFPGDGEFKFPIGVSDESWNPWNVAMIMPLYDHPDLSETDCQIVPAGGVDYKWYMQPDEGGNYKITLNTGIMKITITKL